MKKPSISWVQCFHIYGCWQSFMVEKLKCVYNQTFCDHLQGGRVFTAAALTYSSSVEMYIQDEPGRVEPARVWRSSERIVP